ITCSSPPLHSSSVLHAGGVSMSKELIVSVTPQETKAAILENDQVIEIHIERDKEHGVVGAICKGRVMKVLPGMQSAFVNIGLERDAFLYVSDFFEDAEEYDKLVSTAEDEVVASLQEGGVPKQAPPSPAPQPLPAPLAVAAPLAVPAEKEPEAEVAASIP